MKYLHLTFKDGTDGVVEIREMMGEDYSEETIMGNLFQAAMIRVDSRGIWVAPEFIYSAALVSPDQLSILDMEEETNESNKS